jgi:hypothetical protein
MTATGVVAAYAALLATLSLVFRVFNWSHERRVRLRALVRTGWCDRYGVAVDALILTLVNKSQASVTWATATLTVACNSRKEHEVAIPLRAECEVAPSDSRSLTVVLRDIPCNVDLSQSAKVVVKLRGGKEVTFREAIAPSPRALGEYVLPEIWT